MSTMFAKSNIITIALSFSFYAAMAGISYGQSSKDRSYPAPSVPPYFSSATNKKPEHAGVFPSPPVLGEKVIRQELQAYKVGDPTHPESLPFAERIVSSIRSQLVAGRVIDRVIVTGFADGIPNSGLNLNLRELPVRCSNGVITPVDDGELAHLRGCIILDQISGILGIKYSSGISWTGTEEDEPDGGLQGNPYRKVKVEVFMREKQ